MRDDDPGWPLSWKSLLWLLVPRLGLRRASQGADGQTDGLVVLRQVFLSFCVAIVMFGVVLAFLHAGAEPVPDPSTGVAVILLVVGALGILVEPLVEKPLRCDSDQQLAASYRARFFLRIAFSEAAALFGFVGFFLTYEWWPYPIGAALAVIGFARAAPSRRNLARDEEELIHHQCGRSLVAALRSAPAASGSVE